MLTSSKEKLSGKLGGIAAFLAGEKLEKMETDILNALAGYLKESVRD